MKEPGAPAPRVREVVYPERDGKPMGETDLHREVMNYLIEALKQWFRRAADVYVSGNLMMYYVEGDPRKSVSPDVFVVKGVHKKRRRTYRVWDEAKTPAVVIEVTSRKTRREDMEAKFALYRDVLRVPEYYLYDPEEDYIPGALRAFRLRGRTYVERTLKAGRIRSPELGLDLVSVEEGLRLVDPKSGTALPSLEETEAECRREAAARRREAAARRREAAARARAEEQAQQEAAARVQAEEQAQQEAAARAQAEEQAQQEATARAQAEDQAQQEATARAAAEAEVRRLVAELERVTRKPRNGA